MLPVGLPTPSRSGQDEEGRESYVWKGKEVGHAARMRAPLKGEEWTVNEYEPQEGKVTSVRLVTGSQGFCIVMLKHWLSTHT